MAREIVVQLRDDIDGSLAAETVRFGWRGQEYEIELSEDHLKELEEALNPFVEHGREVKGLDSKKRGDRQPRQPAVARTSRAAELAVVREWARANGYTVSDRGRIPGEIWARYEQAQQQAS